MPPKLRQCAVSSLLVLCTMRCRFRICLSDPQKGAKILISLAKSAEFGESQSEIGSSAPQSVGSTFVLHNFCAVSQDPGIVNEKRTRALSVWLCVSRALGV